MNNAMRPLAVLGLLIGIAFAACGGGDDGSTAPGSGARALGPTPAQFPNPPFEPRTPYPGVAPGYHSLDGATPLPDLPAGAAVYLSLGDSLNYGCCADIQLSSHPRFAKYLSDRLNRPVVWVSLAGNGTLETFLHGSEGQPPQLDQAEVLLQRFRTEGRDVVAIALSIGGNDLLALRYRGCAAGGGRTECIATFQALLESYQRDMLGVYRRLNAVKDPATPIFQNNYYDALNCGRPGDDISTSSLAVQIFNQKVTAAAYAGHGFLVDFYTTFKGHACEYISSVDPTYRGYDEILRLHEGAYESLPGAYVDPWVAP